MSKIITLTSSPSTELGRWEQLYMPLQRPFPYTGEGLFCSQNIYSSKQKWYNIDKVVIACY